MNNQTITGVPGIEVGHDTDPNAMTGCTVVLCRQGAVAGVDVRGCAPGTRETDLLRGYNSVDRIQAILLSGGSAYGLNAAAGVMEYLESQGLGVDVGVGVVPIVPAAVIFDLGVGRADVRPDREQGKRAAESANSAPVACGNVGAGTGATVSKALGVQYAAKGGVGSALMELPNGVKIGALTVVNALGDIYDPQSGALIAAANIEGRMVPCLEHIKSMDAAVGNTTIGVVATNAALTREECNKLASVAHDGLALAIRPVHTPLDGDTYFAMSTGEVKGANMLQLMSAAVQVVSESIVDAIRRAQVDKAEHCC